jgi:hypothetical protein
MKKQNLLVTLASVGLIAGCYTLPEQPNNNKRPNIDDPSQQVPEDPTYDPSTDPDPDPNADPNQDPMQNPDPDPMQNPDPMPNPDPNDPLIAAMGMFNSDVRPILMAKCSAAICHGGTDVSPIKFCPDSAADYYNVVTGYEAQLLGYFDKNTAPIITKIVPGPHNSVTYGADQAKIEAWLDAEYAARQTGMNPPTTPPTGGNSPGQISERLLQEWSGCMNLTDWNTAGVAQAWANKGSGEGPCIRCHINGQASMIATDESERMFNVITTNRYFMSTYFAPNVVDPNNARMEINRPEFERVGTNQYPHIEHPSFNVDGNAMNKLTDFYNLTAARVAAGTCDPPRLPPL